MQRPSGSNADEWNLWLCYWLQGPSQNDAVPSAYLAVQIAEAMDAQGVRLRSQAQEIEALTEGSADKDDEIAMLRDSAARWIARLSVVRELTGDHGKMMLADFTEWFSERWTALLFAEDQIEALKRERDEAIKAAPYCELVEATPENQLETMLYDTLKERDNLRARAEAAESEMAALRERVGVLEKALEPFCGGKDRPLIRDSSLVSIQVNARHVRRARSALEGRK